MTLSRSHRQSRPIFTACRPFTQARESATSVTLVLKSDAVLGGEPSCWYPPTRNVGSVFGNVADDGIPGMLSVADAGPLSWTADRATKRRVSPARSSFTHRSENTC